MAATESPVKVPSLISTGLIVVSVIFPTLSLIAIYLRFAARRRAKHEIASDDWSIIISWILVLSLSINAWVFAGLAGVDYYKIDGAKGTEDSLLCLAIASALVQLPLSAVKIAILLLYKRIFAVPKFQRIVWFLIPFIVCWGVIFFVLLLTQGKPIKSLWEGGGTLRYNSYDLGNAQVGTSIALDLIVLCLPLPLVFKLHMPLKRKLLVAGIFWLGAFCVVAAIVRLVLIDQTVKAVIASQGASYDLVYLQSKQFIFMIIEPNCSIIAGCLPCLGPMIAGGRSPESMVRSVRSMFSLRSRQSSKGSGGVTSNAASSPASDSRAKSLDASATMQGEAREEADRKIGAVEAAEYWHQGGSHEVSIERSDSRSQAEDSVGRINVTNEVRVSSK